MGHIFVYEFFQPCRFCLDIVVTKKKHEKSYFEKISHDNGVLKILKSVVYLKKIGNLFLNSSFNFSILGTSHAQLGFDVMDRVNCKIYYDSS